MAVEVLRGDYISYFRNSLANSSRAVIIMSPFIGFNTAMLLADYIKNSHIRCQVITRFYREDFLNGVSSLDGLRLLVNAGAEVLALNKLHTKLYIFDRVFCVVGSANFTMGGFRLNHELLLAIEEEQDLIEQLYDYFDGIWSLVNGCGDWRLTIDRIDKEASILDKITRNRKNNTVRYRNIEKWGADIEIDVSHEHNDEIERLISELKTEDGDYSSWLKFEGTGEARIDSDERYSPVKLSRDGVFITCFPRSPRGVSDGDWVYLSAISYDNGGKPVPMITGRAQTKGYRKDNKAAPEHIAEHSWMEEYPYFVHIYNIEVIDSEIKHCISLETLVRELGDNVYPGTYGTGLVIRDVLKRHYQKSHIRITPIAKKYLDTKLDMLFTSFGKRIF